MSLNKIHSILFTRPLGSLATCDLERWLEDARMNGWKMPSAPWWKRLPVVRHIRAAYLTGQVVRHQAFWTRATGALHSGYDHWVLWGIAQGMEGDDRD